MWIFSNTGTQKFLLKLSSQQADQLCQILNNNNVEESKEQLKNFIQQQVQDLSNGILNRSFNQFVQEIEQIFQQGQIKEVVLNIYLQVIHHLRIYNNEGQDVRQGMDDDYNFALRHAANETRNQDRRERYQQGDDAGLDYPEQVNLTQMVNDLANGQANDLFPGINNVIVGHVYVYYNRRNQSIDIACDASDQGCSQWISSQKEGIQNIIQHLRGVNGYSDYFDDKDLKEVSGPVGLITAQQDNASTRRNGRGAQFSIQICNLSFIDKIKQICINIGVPLHVDGLLVNPHSIPKEHCILYALQMQLKNNLQFRQQIINNKWQYQWSRIESILYEKLNQDLSVGATDLDEWFSMRIAQLNTQCMQDKQITYEGQFEKYKRIQYKYQYYKENPFGARGIDMGKLKPFQMPQICLSLNHYFSQEEVIFNQQEIDELNQKFNANLSTNSIKDTLDFLGFFYYHNLIEFSPDDQAFVEQIFPMSNECVEACQERPQCLQKFIKSSDIDQLKELLYLYDTQQQTHCSTDQNLMEQQDIVQVVQGVPQFKSQQIQHQICSVQQQKQKEIKFIHVCDTETTIYINNLQIQNGVCEIPKVGPKHELRMICSQRLHYENIQFGCNQFIDVYNQGGNETAQNCVIQWIIQMLDQDYPEIPKDTESIVLELWFHNLAYDASVIVSQMQKFGIGGNTVMKGAKMWQLQFTLPKSQQANLQSLQKYDQYCIQISFRDSYKIITMPVREMPNSFKFQGEKIQVHKEIYPYNCATKQMFEQQGGQQDINYMYQIEQTLQQQVGSQIDYSLQDFQQSAIKANALNGNMINMIQYTRYYCEIDVDILRVALTRFHMQMKANFNINPLQYLSISSLAQQIQAEQGCFSNVYSCYGRVQEFLQRCAIGGRTMCAQNQQQRHDCIYIPDNKIYKLNTSLKQAVQQTSLQQDSNQIQNNAIPLQINSSMISDFDGVSLYPSSMARVYYPAGLAHYLTQDQINYFNNPENLFHITETGFENDSCLTLFIKVKIINAASLEYPQGTDGWKNYKFPLQSQKNKITGTRYFTNYIRDQELYMSHIALQDIVTFQHAKYQILEGYYYTERNYKIQDVIKQMFNMRLVAKQNNNTALSTLLKLLMNSGYGKLLQKPTNTKTVSFSSVLQKDQRIQFRSNIEEQFRLISQQEVDMSNTEKQMVHKILENVNLQQLPIRKSLSNYRNLGNKEFVDYTDAINGSKNLAQCGVLVLDMSKRIMNEVMTLAEDLNIPIYYQDTDSMHIDSNQLNRLQQAFKQKYHRDLIGNQMGQFHSDFDSENGEVIGAINTICLAKKVYCDNLLVGIQCDQNGQKQKDGKFWKIVQEYHLRFKGITTEALFNMYKRIQILTPNQVNTIQDVYLKQELLDQIQELINKHNERKKLYNASNTEFHEDQIDKLMNQQFAVFISPKFKMLDQYQKMKEPIDLYDFLSESEYGLTIDLAWSGKTIMGRAQDKLSKVTLSSFKRSCQFFAQMSDEDVLRASMNL